MDDHKMFLSQGANEAQRMGADPDLKKLTQAWMESVTRFNYSYHFEWLGRPIIQFPQDIVAMQEIIWGVKPDLIIETGIARGGSLVLSASLLALLDLSEQLSSGNSGPVEFPRRKVIGIDIDIRSHNREAIEKHPFFPWIEMLEGSSTSPDVVDIVGKEAESAKTVLVMLDSNHTHDHVLDELRAYAPLVSKGSYVIVFDSIVEDMPKGFYSDRTWDKGNNPKTAIREFLGESSDFKVDVSFQDKLLITVCPDGFLRKA